MYYPVLFFLPGFFILVSSIDRHSNSAIAFITEVACMAAFVFQSWIWLGWALLASLVAGFVLNEPGLPQMALFGGLGWVLVSIALAAKCPRCEYGIGPSRNPWRRNPTNQWCAICGRTRRGVWPGQYLVKPETWDGEYHDEGGGPPEPGILDWWREVLFKRIRKRQLKRNRQG